MCGIVGYIGSKDAVPVLMEGLSSLSYRGYDSAGIAVMDEKKQIHIRKTRGKLTELENLLKHNSMKGSIGIGHTRWATHGEPNDLNAHPHTDVTGGIAVVHNGIIENHEEIKKFLERHEIKMNTQTDTEVIAHLISLNYDGNMIETLSKAMNLLVGSYAIAVLCDQEPEKLFCLRNDSPLVLGFCDGESFLASDIPAMLKHTRDVLFLQDREIAVLERNGVSVFNAYGVKLEPSFFHVDWNKEDAEKGGYAHFMLKEIHEQPQALHQTVSKYMNSPWTEAFTYLRAIEKITIVACGTAYHAGLYGRYAIECLARIPVIVETASEYRYQNPIVFKNELVIAVSQSGETADTLAAIRLAKRNGAHVMAICNVVGSSIVREVGEENTLYTYAGPEIAVASTKAYLTQAMTLLLFAKTLAQICPKDKVRLDVLDASLRKIKFFAEKTLRTENQIQRLTSRLVQKRHVFFIGRGADFALSMEAALKLKEVSYIYGESYAAGELKHGPLALIEEGSVVFAAVTQPELLEKTLNNLQEARTRGAYLLAVSSEQMTAKLAPHVNELITIPDADPLIAPILAAIPFQLFAYNMAVERGCDVDQPRNLAKSVTVE